MSAGAGDEYSPTFFDKHGPEAASYWKMASYLALASYEEIILELPDDPQPRIRAADLCAKSRLPERAEILFRAVQRMPRISPKDDIYVSNRLVDLYLAWPGHETKGLRELRRLIDTYPETDVADRARAGLQNLKSQLGVTE
jgi:hypothetical protein